MSKADFIEIVAKQGKVSKADAKRAIELVFGAVEVSLKGLKNGGKFQIGTFGTFATTKRGARIGRNPRTGEFDQAQGVEVASLQALDAAQKGRGLLASLLPPVNRPVGA